GLNSVLCQVDVAEDQHRDRQASVARRARQGIEGVRVALLRQANQLFLHPSLRARASAVWADRMGERLAKPRCSISVDSGVQNPLESVEDQIQAEFELTLLL